MAHRHAPDYLRTLPLHKSQREVCSDEESTTFSYDVKMAKVQTSEGKTTKPRCHWCNQNNPLYVDYHDTEWGVPVHDDNKMFELLILEGFQAGLSWECILNKRKAFRRAFDDFNYRKVAEYNAAKLEALRHDNGIVRNNLKIAAAVSNAKAFMDIQTEYGSFDKFIWSFTGGRIIRECDRTSSPLSDTISTELKRRGMKFVGTTIIYSYLQAIGIINSHEKGCWLHIE